MWLNHLRSHLGEKANSSYASMRGLALVSSYFNDRFHFFLFKYSKFMNSGSLGKILTIMKRTLYWMIMKSEKTDNFRKDKVIQIRRKKLKILRMKKINEEKIKRRCSG